jgi:amino acid transporter
MDKLKDTLRRWQEFTGWLPLAVILALSAWLVLGALLPWGAATAVESVIELAVLLAYALAATGVARLAWRRWRQPMSDEARSEYWRGIMAGERGPIIAHAINAAVYLSLCVALLLFFSPPR